MFLSRPAAPFLYADVGSILNIDDVTASTRRRALVHRRVLPAAAAPAHLLADVAQQQPPLPPPLPPKQVGVRVLDLVLHPPRLPGQQLVDVLPEQSLCRYHLHPKQRHRSLAGGQAGPLRPRRVPKRKRRLPADVLVLPLLQHRAPAVARVPPAPAHLSGDEGLAKRSRQKTGATTVPPRRKGLPLPLLKEVPVAVPEAVVVAVVVVVVVAVRVMVLAQRAGVS